MNMWILKLAVMNALLYVGLVFGIDVILMAMARLKGIAGTGGTHSSLFIFLGILWSVSYWIAYLVFVSGSTLTV